MRERSVLSFAVLLMLLATTERASGQSANIRGWLDLQAGIGNESRGSTDYWSTTASVVSLAATERLSRHFGLQLVGDFHSDVLRRPEPCGVGPSGGPIAGCFERDYRAAGLAAALVATAPTSAGPPTWSASLGAGIYRVGYTSISPSAGLRAATEWLLMQGHHAGLVASAGALILPMGASSPITVFDAGLGIRAW